jgi:pyruvate formate lyase activating enzyme
MHEARLYKSLEEGAVQCLACRQGCRIAPGKTGICGVRKNIDGKLFLTVYGQPVAVQIDPIEKKPLYHFLPGTEIFSLGTVGCNFACSFCQNWDISQFGKKKTLDTDLSFLQQKPSSELTPHDIVERCVENNIPSIAFTYNEPTIFAEYAADVMKLAKPAGIRGVFVSNGYESEQALDYLDGWIDAYNIDLKAFNEVFYQRICKARLKNVLQTIASIHRRGNWLELTTLLIPGENDSVSELNLLTKFIASLSADIPWHVSAFHPDYQMQEKRGTSYTSMEKAFEIGRKAGLKYIYLGNTEHLEHSHTFCAGCGLKLIERSFLNTERNIMHNGGCPECGMPVSGIWQ